MHQKVCQAPIPNGRVLDWCMWLLFSVKEITIVFVILPSALLDVNKQIVQQRDEFYVESEKLRRNATPRYVSVFIAAGNKMCFMFTF